MEIYCKTCDKVLGHYPDEKIPLNVRMHTTCKRCGTRIDILRTSGNAGGSLILNIFRVLSIIEGLSLIALMGVALPAKYYFEYFDIVWNTGMVHGILWSVYFIMSLVVSHVEKWRVTMWIAALFASMIPFACFFLEKRLKAQFSPA